MARNKSKSEIAKMTAGAGMIATFASELFAKVEERGGTAEQLHRLVEPRGEWLLDAMADLIVSQREEPVPVSFIESTHKVSVDYRIPRGTMIAVGEFDRVDESINFASFPMEGEGVVDGEFFLVGFRQPVTIEQVKADLEQRKFRPATLWEILALAVNESKVQRTHKVVAAGSIFQRDNGDHACPYLSGNDRERTLEQFWHYPEEVWHDQFRFAAVRK
jgi:hypothetical protein